MPPIEEIRAERHRQIHVECWTPEHDDEHGDGEILRVAVLYYHHAKDPESVRMRPDGAPMGWPWAIEWWKPKDRHRDLVRAGALCLAEIDRLRRANAYTDHVRHKLGLILDALTEAPAHL